MHETKLRVVAPDVGGGFGSKLDVYAEELLAVALASRLGRPVKWVEERSENYLATIHGRDFVTEYTLAATKDGTITHCRAKVIAAMGAYLQLVTPGIPLLGAWIYAGPVRDPQLQRRVPGRLHEHDADRCVPRRGSAGGDLRDRADDGRARRRARHGPPRAAPEELHHGVPVHARLGSDDRLGRLPRVARPAPRGARPGRDPERAGEAARERRRQAARRRLLDLQRDVRARAVAHPRRDPLRGRRLGPGDDPLPADGLGPGDHRHVAARPEPRDRLGPDRRRPARLRHRRRWRCSTATRRSRRSGWTPTAAAASRSAAWRCGTPARRSIEKARQIVAHQWEVAADDLVFENGTFSREGLAGQGDDAAPPWRSVAWAAHDLPDGHGAHARGDGRLRPAELLLAGRRARRGRRGRHGDGRHAARPVRRGRRRRRRREPGHRRRTGARRASRRASPRPSTRRASTTRTATCRPPTS